MLMQFIQLFMKQLHVLMSWPKDMNVLKIKFSGYFCSVNFSQIHGS